MSIRDEIEAKLTAEFAPDYLEVIDESRKHQHHEHRQGPGHAPHDEAGESHFRVRIAAQHFDGMTRLAQHRAVMEALDAQIKAGVHALAVEMVGPEGPVKKKLFHHERKAG